MKQKSIHLAQGFWENPKTQKLEKELGLDGIKSLQKLWLWAAENRPDGVLKNMSAYDIEKASGWGGFYAEFFWTLTHLAWIIPVKNKENDYKINDWEKYQPELAAIEWSNDDDEYLTPPLKQDEVLRFPLSDSKYAVITTKDMNRWELAFPHLDILPILRKMVAWNEANPKRRKTVNGWRRHVFSWLAREDEKRQQNGNDYKPGYHEELE